MNQGLQQTGGPSTATLLLWVMTSLKGRISRQVYWLALLAVLMVYFAFMMPVAVQYSELMLQAVSDGVDQETVSDAVNIPMSLQLMSLASTVLWVIIGIKRLHDFNASGLFAIFLIFPFASLFATILIGLIPGTPGPNRFGEHTDRIPPT